MPTYLLKPFNLFVQGNPAEIESLAPGNDRRGQSVRLCCSQNEHNVSRRLLQSFQQGVKRLGSQHMNFVNNVYLMPDFGRRVFNFVPDVPDFFDPAIGGGVNFKNVHDRTFRYTPTRGTFITRFGSRAIQAIYGFCHDFGNAGFAGSPRPVKQVRMGNAAFTQRILQCLYDVLLADHILKSLRSPRSIQCDMCHNVLSHGLLRMIQFIILQTDNQFEGMGLE
jgi:hypothetical protein